MIRSRGVKLGRLLGFPIYVDATLLIIVGLLVLFEIRGGLEGFARGLVFFGVLVGSVLWHELGHAIAVRRLKLGESEIVLSGLGGVTIYKNNPNPKQGIIIALSGPGAGLLLGLILLAVELTTGGTTGLLGYALSLAVVVNLVLNVANLMPTYPLDGGQVLRFILSRKMEEDRALKITVIVGSVVLAGGAVALYLYSGFSTLFTWFILLILAGENVRLWKHATGRR